ncbi:DivIVA domain-containing protein [Abyssicoccus albus]|uniref:Cell division initiation protein n=1 Tax=Abyssicoccus albus TaxID=1817405 RepID=A0A1Q1G287_9BACL|nr:DivIVA domain-containing protein [Abyssicoccus albus]AQL56369.1 hypothetical protein BVH56_05275 [Abyssicoccus albus]RPF57799.1 cell division initiation protein [Abyssicoccus albus]
MNINDIPNKSFKTVYKGIDEMEVREYLKEIKQHIEELEKEKESLQKIIDEKNENLNNFKSVETSISEAIMVAQKAGEETKRSAEKESERIINQARLHSETMINDAMMKSQHIAMQTEEIKKQSKVFRARYKKLIEAQLDLLSTNDWEELLEYDKDINVEAQSKVDNIVNNDDNVNN